MHEIACITYTSGTTGPSKAVKLPWGQLHSINLGTFPFEDLAPIRRLLLHHLTCSFRVQVDPLSRSHGRRSSRHQVPFCPQQLLAGRLRVRHNDWHARRIDGGLVAEGSRKPLGQTSLKNLFMAPLGACYEQFSERFSTRICTVYNSTEGGVAIRSGWNPTNARTVGSRPGGLSRFRGPTCGRT